MSAPKRKSASQHSPERRFDHRQWLCPVLLLAALGYLAKFFASGELRAAIYNAIVPGFLLLPDELVGFLWNEWTQGAAPAIADRGLVFGVAAILLASAWGAGRLCLPRAAVSALTGLERQLFSLAVGLSIWSLFALLIGLAGGLRYPWLFRALMLTAMLAGAWREWKYRSELTTSTLPASPVEPTWDRRAKLALALLAVPLVLLCLLTAALPPWEFDVREYHLQVPKEWFQQGRIGFLPHNVYGNMPLGAEMQALLGMLWMPGPLAWWWGALAGKVVLGAEAVATALALYAFARRYATPLAGAIAAIVYLSTPWVFQVSTIGLVEGAVGFYLWMTLHAAVIGWLNWRNQPAGEADPSASRSAAVAEGRKPPGVLQGEADQSAAPSAAGGQLLALACFLAGSAVACKYPALLFVGAPCLTFVGWILLRSRGSAGTQPDGVAPASRRQAICRALACGLLFAAACGPWFAKNAVLAGNPVYPLAYRLFGGRTWTAEKDDRWRRAHGPQRDQQGARFSAAQLSSSVALLGWASDLLSPLVWPLAMFFPLVVDRRRNKILLAVAGCVVYYFAVWWLLTHRVDRFFVPAFPLVAFLAGVGACWSAARAWRWPVLVLVIACVLLNLVVLATGRLAGYTHILVPLESLRADRAPPHRIDAPLRYLNQHVPPGSRALLVGEAQAFDLEVEAVYNTCWDDLVLETWFRGRSREERVQILRDNRISHILVSWREIERYRSPGNYGFSDFVTPQLLHEELADEQQLLRFVPVPPDDGVDESAVEIFEVL